MGNALFRGLVAPKPLGRFSKKITVDYAGEPNTHASIGSIGSKGVCLRMREIVTLSVFFFFFPSVMTELFKSWKGSSVNDVSSTHWLIHWLIDWLTNSLTDWLTDWDWFIHSLIHSLIHSCMGMREIVTLSVFFFFPSVMTKGRLYERRSNLHWVHSTYWVYSNPHSNNFHCMKQTRSQFEFTYLSENLSDLFRKQRLWLVRDDITRRHNKISNEHGVCPMPHIAVKVNMLILFLADMQHRA